MFKISQITIIGGILQTSFEEAQEKFMGKF